MKRQHGHDPVPDEQTSLQFMDAIYDENRAFFEAPTPELVGPPAKWRTPPLQYVSSEEFDSRVSSLCRRIKEALIAKRTPHVILWLPPPGTSNFWMTFKCWPLLRQAVTEVWPLVTRRQYVRGAQTTTHLLIDDAFLMGDRMDLYLHDLIDGARPLVLQAAKHDWVLAAMASTGIARDDLHFTMHEILNVPRVTFVHEIDVVTYQDGFADDEPHYTTQFYFGYKIPDSGSLANLRELVNGGYIPGQPALDPEVATPEEEDEYGHIVRVIAPIPPYCIHTVTFRGQPIPLAVPGGTLTQ